MKRFHEFLFRVRAHYYAVLARVHVAMGELSVDDLVDLAMVDPAQPSTWVALVKPILLGWFALRR